MSRSFPGALKPVRLSRLPLAIVAGLLLAGAAAAFAAEPAAGREPAAAARPAPPANERATLRAEQSVAQALARLDEALGLGTFPDATPLWLARLAAALEVRGSDEPAQALLRNLAVELRGLGVDWALGGPPDRRPDGRPVTGSPPGRERAERIRRIRELAELVDRKLGLHGEGHRAETAASDVPPSGTGTAGPSHRSHTSGNDSCSAAPALSLGEIDGYTTSATNDGSASCGGPTPSPDVWYTFTAPEDGSYTFETIEDSFYSQFDTVLSLHAACPLPGDDQELACSDDAGASLFSSISHPLSAGQVVKVRIGGYDGATGQYTLRVTLTRTIRGSATHEDSGAPVAGATVEILTYWGYVIAETTTGTDGSYAASVRADPELYARVRDDRFVTEMYDDMECPFNTYCDTFYADSISLASGDASGIDFTLDPAGSISGALTAADTGQPLPGTVYVEVYDEAGSFVGSSSFDGSDGGFEISSVHPGTYYLRASSSGYVAEVWPDVHCRYPCDPTTGTPVVVAEESEATGVDFVLDRLGRVQGTVVDAGTGDPVGSVPVYVYDDAGSYAGSVYTDGEGGYSVGYLSEGLYFARTQTTAYLDELYDDLPCESACDVTGGTAITVRLNDPATGIDFSLVAKASISGTVADVDTGDPLDLYLELYDASGAYRGSRSTYSPAGSYTFRGLDAGTYYLRTRTYSTYYSTHENELYDDRPCEPDCDVTTGTPVAAAATSQVTGIDFQLDRRGWIAGTVTETGTGSGVWDVSVGAYRLDGTLAGQAYTQSDGSYQILNLPGGTYRVGTWNHLHRDEMYPDVPCGDPCDRTTGSEVTVQSNLETPGIDVALDRLGSISGTVRRSSSGATLPSYVYLLDPGGETVGFGDSWSGAFTIAGIHPGTYYLKAREDDYYGSYQDELYPDVPCEPDCDLSQGTAIVIGLGSVLTGYDLALAACPAESREEVSATLVTTYLKAAACDLVTATGVTLAPGADVLFRSGRSVVLGDGFVVEEGARFRAVIEPAWRDD